MNILFCHPGADRYGSDEMAVRAVEALLAAGHRLTCVVTTDGPLVRTFESLGVDCHILEVPVLRKEELRLSRLIPLVFKFIRGFGRSVSLLYRLRPDTIMVNTITLPTWLLVGALMRIPTCVVVHEADAGDNSFLQQAVLAPLGLATRLLPVSSAAAAFLRTSFLARRRAIEVVPNGGDWSRYFVSEYVPGAQPSRIVVIGRLSPRKGQDLVIDAAAVLHARGIDVEICFAGDTFRGYEWYEESLIQQADALGIRIKCHFLGFVEDIPKLLSGCDLVVVPSRLPESFGLVAVEAMAAKRPVVVSDSGALGSIVIDGVTGLVVPPDDHQALATAIERVVQQPQFAVRLVEAAYVSVHDRFGLHQYQERLQAAIKRTTAGVGP